MKLRHEYKHRINMFDIVLLRNRLKTLMKYDEFSNKDGKYFVKSLYFDNYNDRALRQKTDGVDKREKFRIRLYNNDTSFIRLEKKSKINNLCHKVSEIITKKECEKILKNDIDFLMKKDKDLFREFYAKMRYQLLRPKSIVAYTRESFCYPLGNVRITIDTGIKGSYDTQSFLKDNTKYNRSYTEGICEVKYDEFIPRIICNLVGAKSRRAASFSKYANTR